MIPASELVQVNPSVLIAGGSSVDALGLMLTNGTDIPLGTVPLFPTAQSMSDYFGPSSQEYALGLVYFAGYTNSLKKPSGLWMSQYPTAAVAAYMRSGSLASMTLAQLNAIPAGVLTVTLDGVVKTSSSINLATATSFSNAATLIAAAFTGGPNVTFDAQHKMLKFTSTTTGAASTITFGTGTISAALLTTAATGAQLSQGSIAYTPATALAAISAITLNWVSVMTTFEPLLADKILFGTWVAQQNNRFVYECWDTDANAIVSGNTTAFGPQVAALTLTGSVPLYNSVTLAAAKMGATASLDFSQTNGRYNYAYMQFAAQAATVTDVTIARTLDANGYNFYGQYGTSSETDILYQPGSIGGAFAWQDSYVGQIKLNSSLQSAALAFMMSIGSNPYNAAGYAALETALLTPINAALNYGTIRPGVTLSGSQIAAVNAAAGGRKIDQVFATRGWYLLITDPTPEVRAARGTPAIRLFYMDGGSMQTLTIASVAVQ